MDAPSVKSRPGKEAVGQDYVRGWLACSSVQILRPFSTWSGCIGDELNCRAEDGRRKTEDAVFRDLDASPVGGTDEGWLAVLAVLAVLSVINARLQLWRASTDENGG